MILSRRQRESLLDEMTRMLANKQHVAFANHSKIAERVSNGDLAFYIDSTKKEFVVKYTDKTMKFNAKEKTFSELNALIFENKQKITGISDSTNKSSSTIALSTKWGKTMDVDITAIKNKFRSWNPSGFNISASQAVIEGITDEGKYATQHILTYEYWKDHEEKCKCEDKEQQEQQQQNYDNRYAFKNHTHNNYANANHTHDGLWTEDEIRDLIEDETEEPWYKKLFKGLEVVNEVVQDGYIIALQQQINACYAALAANNMIDSVQSVSGLGALVQGVSGKLGTVANGLDWLGSKFPKISNAVSKISQPIRNIANKLQGYRQIVDDFFDTTDGLSDLVDFTNRTAHHINHTGTIDDMLTEKLLPDTFSNITRGALEANGIDTSWIPSSTVAR